MPKKRAVLTTSLLSLVFVAFMAMQRVEPAFADTTTTSSPSSSTTTTGPTKPTGADANTYTYDPTTGMWENQYYIWNPQTGQTQPRTPQTYSYNPSTGMWDTTQWVYDATSGTYIPNTISVSQPPAGAPTVNAPTTTTTSPSGASTSGPTGSSSVTSPPSPPPTISTSTNQPNTSTTTTSTSPDSSTTTNTTPTTSSITTNSPNGSTNTTNTSNNANGTFDLFYNAAISGTLTSNAQSGDATVSNNTTGGSATTGNAEALANLINLLQSSGNFSGANFTTFMQNITGNVNGNITIDPNALLQALGNVNNALNNVKLESQANGSINNNVNLDAQSGNATVSNNTTGGNATSGQADAVANVINLINSMIASNQSFLGVINIYGDLNGNILVPADFLNSLLGSNSPSTSSQNQPALTTDTGAVLNNNQTVNNAVNASAASGQATVSNNTSAGNSTTGLANTNVTILNLTGQQVIGSNALLVFVNVLGTWVGMILNAPQGSTAAALGGGITQDSSVPQNTNVTGTSNESINNNIDALASSGNALVNHNTLGGNATSGNATASVNLANILGSQFSLTNWFGILFINVFGSWYGNFGVATNNPPASSSTTSSATSTTNAPDNETTTEEVTAPSPQVFVFTPTTTSNVYTITPISTNVAIFNDEGGVGQSNVSSTGAAIVLAASTAHPGNGAPAPDAASTSTNLKSSKAINAIVAAAGLIVGLGLLAVERYLSSKTQKSN